MCKRERKCLNNVITKDETWVFEYDLETKRQSSEWHTHLSPPLKKARVSKSKIKIMLIVFFNIDGLVHHEFEEPGTTVNSKFYVDVLERLKRRVQHIRPDIAHNWKLHHDNVLAHSAFIVTDYLVNAVGPTIPQPPYSLGLAPP
ncbi:histone-lysine N-methyltransferase SETMAR-like [Dermacentor albipictus]|uniref:histone-lysine N-methyltransferase SETMAR-like n=1 Tax=Dermacentor albipictus TaxID=60249 RepID=UPI0038FCDBEF